MTMTINTFNFDFSALVDAIMASIEAEADEEVQDDQEAEQALKIKDQIEKMEEQTNIEAIMEAQKANAPLAFDPFTMSLDDLIFWLLISVQTAFNNKIMEKAADVQNAQDAVANKDNEPMTEQDEQKAQSTLDQETQALQRLLTKRQQFVDMFLQMLKKLDESVEKVWQTMS